MMDLQVKICEIEDHTIRIEDCSNFTEGNDNLTYKDTMTINILEYESMKGNELIEYVIKDHDCDTDETNFRLSKDGYYTITHIVLPSIDWLKALTELPEEYSVYVTDGYTIFKYCQGDLLEVPIDLIKEINPEYTTISKVKQDLFYIKYLRLCFIDYCNAILDATTFKCLSKNSNSKDEVWKRDFIWMTLNAINFYVEDNLLCKAQRLLEIVNYCGGLCNGSNSINKRVKDCGCSKK